MLRFGRHGRRRRRQHHPEAKRHFIVMAATPVPVKLNMTLPAASATYCCRRRRSSSARLDGCRLSGSARGLCRSCHRARGCCRLAMTRRRRCRRSRARRWSASSGKSGYDQTVFPSFGIDRLDAGVGRRLIRTARRWRSTCSATPEVTARPARISCVTLVYTCPHLSEGEIEPDP